MEPRDLVAAARQGSVRAATRLVTLLEDDPSRLPDLMAGLGVWPAPRLVVGLTGAPGVGKSTLADRLIAEFRKQNPEKRIGVVAVDPSSPFTGGALLGDRVRMMRHATDPLVFIRSLATRGHLGGLTLGIKGTLRILGLLGCDLVLLETVGVGQSEVEVAAIADLTAVLLAPGQGDDVQLLKAGLLEAADLFVVNKADRPGADRLAGTLAATLALAGREAPPVLLTVAAEGRGVTGLLSGLEGRAAALAGRIAARRLQAAEAEARQALHEAVRARVERALAAGPCQDLIKRILCGGAALDEAARAVLAAALESERRSKP